MVMYKPVTEKYKNCRSKIISHYKLSFKSMDLLLKISMLLSLYFNVRVGSPT